MKKIKLLVTVGVCLCFYQSFSQSMYAQFSVGYGLPSGSQQIGTERGYTGPPDYSYFERSVDGSFGTGVNFTGSFGYMFSSSVGLDVSVNYLLGKKYKDSYTDVYSLYESIDKTESKASGISVTPSLLINFGGTKFSPYAKLGVAVGSFTINEKTLDQSTYDGAVEYSEKEERKTTGELSIGIRGGIGLTYIMSGNISLFGECLYTGMNYKPKETETTSYTENGQDLLDQMSESQKRTIYVEELGYGSEDPNVPREELQTPNPLSSISFNFGVRFAFGGI